MAICGVVASESLLTYDRNPPGMLRTSRSLPVRSGGIPRSALHLAIPEQAPMPNNRAGSRRRWVAGFAEREINGAGRSNLIEDTDVV